MHFFYPYRYIIYKITYLRIEMNLHAFLTLCGYLQKLF